jgi:hypothetical protein
MYLMYVDESGDPGTNNSQVNYFILSGLVIHELDYNNFMKNLVDFRKHLRNTKGLKLREEIHSSDFINSHFKNKSIKRNDRVDILKQCIKFISGKKYVNIINIVVDKRKFDSNIFEYAWQSFIQRFENTIKNKNFPGKYNNEDKGIIITDSTDSKKLQSIVRKMHNYNPVPNTQMIFGGGYRNLQIKCIIEDPFHRDSKNTYIIQLVDVIAYSVRQLYEPNKYFKSKSGSNLFYELSPVLCKYASTKHPYGIVEK